MVFSKWESSFGNCIKSNTKWQFLQANISWNGQITRLSDLKNPSFKTWIVRKNHTFIFAFFRAVTHLPTESHMRILSRTSLWNAPFLGKSNFTLYSRYFWFWNTIYSKPPPVQEIGSFLSELVLFQRSEKTISGIRANFPPPSNVFFEKIRGGGSWNQNFSSQKYLQKIGACGGLYINQNASSLFV